MIGRDFIGFFVSLIISVIVFLPEPCNSQVAATQPKPPAVKSKVAWQQDWDKTLQGARREGKVTAFTSFGSSANNKIAEAFRKRYGLDMQFVVGTAPALLVKAESERKAGLFLEDIYVGGLTNFRSFKDAGYLQPVKPIIMLPEVLDRKAWMGGELFFSDKEGMEMAYQIKVVPPLIVNTNFVKPEEIKSYKDLLNPRWKEKIVVFDPAKGAHGPMSFMIFWEFMGPEFTRKLASQLVIVADSRQQTEWVARGKYPISSVMSADTQAEFVKAGAPLKVVVPAEGTFISAGKGGLALLDKAPHPNAAKIFANWLLTREGQTVMCQVSGNPSRRLDVSAEWVSDASFLVQPGVKYVDGDSEVMRRKRVELQKIYRDVWGSK